MAFLLASATLLGLTVLATAVETSQAFRFWWVDPWPAEQPALWTPSSGHVERLEAAAARLRRCLDELESGSEVLAVAPDPRLGGQGLYWVLWLISMLPDMELKPLGEDGDPAPARLLLTSRDRQAPAGQQPVCVAEPLRLYLLDGNLLDGEASGEPGEHGEHGEHGGGAS